MEEETQKLGLILQNVNDWLKFSEAKNAVLLGFSGAGISAIVAVVPSIQNLPKFTRLCITSSAILLLVSILACSLSFLPQTNLKQLIVAKKRSTQHSKIDPEIDNLFYFGDLKKYKPDELLDVLDEYYFKHSLKAKSTTKEYRDIAAQIVVNSGIVFRKLVFFRYALYCLLGAIFFVTPVFLSYVINILFV